MVRQPSKSRARRGIESLLADYQHALGVLQDLTTEFAEQMRELEAHAAGEDPMAGLDAGRSARVEIACLGSFEIRIDGRTLPLPSSGRPAGVLKLLADRGGRPTSRDLLIETLWPDVDPDAGANRLRVAVHSLRQIDDGLHELVTFDQGHYQLNGPRVEIDAERFEALLAGAHSLERAGDIDRALSVYHEAEQLYRGDYFEEDPFEDWALLRRQHLRDLYLNLLVKLSVLALERGDYEACITHCHEIVRQDNCSEDAYRLLMLAHAHRGNRARALRWYALCEQTLLRELEVDPSATTVALRDEILSEDLNDGRSLRQRLGLGVFGAIGVSVAGIFGTPKVAVAAAAVVVGLLLSASADQINEHHVAAADEGPVGQIAASELEARPAGTNRPQPDVPEHLPFAFNMPQPATTAPPQPDVVEVATPGNIPPDLAATAPTTSDPLETAGSPAPPVAPDDDDSSTGSPSDDGSESPGKSGSAGGGPPDHAGPPDQAGPPENAGPPEDAGPPTHANAPDHAGPPDQAGPPDHAGPPENAGPPESIGPPENTSPSASAGQPAPAGPPAHSNAPESAGPPDDAGPSAGANGGKGAKAAA